jgi:hypothetical protein
MKQIVQLCGALLTFLGVSAFGQLAGVSANYNDHPLFDRFPDSEIISAEFDEDVNYRLVLSSLQRTRGLVTPESSERLRGDVTKIVYEVSQEFTGEDVYNFFQQQLQERNYTDLFTCSGRGCGSSNYWANDIFGNRILYGPERNQYYLAARADNGLESSPHLALYIITRGNRRIYAYLEIIEVGGTKPRIDIIEPNELLATLREQGSVTAPSLNFIADNQLTIESDLAPIANMLETDTSLNIYLVVHLGGSGSLDSLMARSLMRAELIKQQLQNLGIDGSRIIAQGVGPLAPICGTGNCQDRIEVVLR